MTVSVRRERPSCEGPPPLSTKYLIRERLRRETQTRLVTASVRREQASLGAEGPPLPTNYLIREQLRRETRTHKVTASVSTHSGTRHTLLAASPFTLSGTRPKGIKEARSSGIKGARTEGIKGVLPPSRERGPKASRESCPEAVDGLIDSHTDRQKDGQMVDRQTDHA